MYPNFTTPTSFEYPNDRLLPLRGVIEEDELLHPKSLDENNEPCLLVIKNGARTGETIGCATGMMSFVREHSPYNIHKTSMELAICSYDHKDGPFSAPGDSGAIIADPTGRIVGLLTGGSGLTNSVDITKSQ